MHEAGVNRPFRFLYMSGFAVERDQTKTPTFYPEYTLMRVSLLTFSSPAASILTRLVVF